MKTSQYLEVGQTYTREQLKSQFEITDATINTGVFQPKGHQSIWLFITEKKTKDRTAYQDHLDGDQLHWDGQTQGRKDHLIIEHQARNLELIVFYREKKYQYPKAAFRYEGTFRYQSHHGEKPRHFLLTREKDRSYTIETAKGQELAEAEGAFAVESIEDSRQKTMKLIASRRGQATFRRNLMAAYQATCCVSGCTVPEALEAAHIHPYRGTDTNNVTNGLLLRSDIHTLFDLGLIWVGEAFTVHGAYSLEGTEYQEFFNRTIRLPVNIHLRPSLSALEWHRVEIAKQN